MNETDVLVQDAYSSNSDVIVLEEGTLSTGDIGSIKKVRMLKDGAGYTKLPTLNITSAEGTSGSLYCSSTDIGRVLSVDLRDGGFNYDEVPKSSFVGHFVLIMSLIEASNSSAFSPFFSSRYFFIYKYSYLYLWVFLYLKLPIIP